MTALKKIREERHRVSEGGGNVFADLGLPNPEMLRLKAGLSARIERIMMSRKLRRKELAAILGVDASEVSNLFNGKFSKYSLDRYSKFLLALGDDVEIVTCPKPKSRKKAEITYRESGGGSGREAGLKKPAAKRKSAPNRAAAKRRVA